MPWGAYRNFVLVLDRTSASVGAVRVAEAMVLEERRTGGDRSRVPASYGGMLGSAGIAAGTVSKYSGSLAR